MKMFLKTIVFFITLGIGNGFAQTNVYHPFPDSNAIWREENYCWYNPNPLLGEYHSYVNSLAGDTLIGTAVYKKILQSGEQRYNSSALQHYANVYIGGIRQDTSQRKVFFIEPGKPDTLLYDFSLSIGDTIRSYNNYFNPCIVTSIDSILIGGSYRKRFQICGSNIIEGIGDALGLLYRKPAPCILRGAELACFTQNGQTIYHPDTTSNCSAPDGINELNKNLFFEISPNPSSGFFSLFYSERVISIEILDVLGNVILSMAIKNSQEEIDISSQSKGLYFIKVVDEKGNFGVRKIVLQ